ncbi:MAG: UPF0236 family protein, partial [Anaerolineaceae bacterium]
MTEQAVQIIITIKLGDESREVEQSIAIEELEGGLVSLNQSMQVSLGGMIFEMLDAKIHQQRPRTWQSLGTAPGSLMTECGEIQFRRHIYWVGGERLRPVDLLLNISPYARNSKKVEAMGACLAAESSYRQAARLLSYAIKQELSPSTLCRMVRRVGKKVQEWEAQEGGCGTLPAPLLYCEADGVYVHLQREAQKKAEVKVGVFYTGETAIAKNRYRCEHKLATCQSGMSTLDWQVHLRELAFRHYNFDTVKLAVVGGDGANWVQNSFDLLGLPTVHLLDRFHVIRSLKRGYAKLLDISEVSKTLFTQGFDEIAPQLEAGFAKAGTPLRKRQTETYAYLNSHKDSLTSLDQRGLPYSFSSLGAMEGNVDKLVRQRMRGRGLSWSLAGAHSMLAVLRHKDLIKSRAFLFQPLVQPRHHSVNRPVKRAAPK